MAPPLPATYRPMLIDSGLRAAANRTPDKVAITAGDRHLTFRRLIERIDRVAQAALQTGVQPGQNAALLAANCLEYIEIVAGLASIGLAVATPSPRLSEPEVRAILQDCGATLLITDAASHPGVSDTATLLGIRTIVIGPDYEAWIARASSMRPDIVTHDWQSFSIPYTSGTTGAPKGVLLPHRSRVLSYFGMAVEFGCYSPDDRAVATAPMCHGAGLSFALAPIFFGGSVEILAKFDPEELLRTLHATGATNVFVVPTHLHALFDLGAAVRERYRPRALRAMICNAAPLPQASKQRVLDYFGDDLLHELYGSTEAGNVANLRPADQRRKQACVGLPFPGNEVRLLREDGAEAAPGEVGELYSRSAMIFNGYWNRPEETACAFREDGWFSAGDLATRDAEGYISIVDRKKDMVISGGINIYPREIEEVLFAHPGVAEAAVIGVPDDKWGEALWAFVVTPPGAEIADAQLEQHCRRTLSGYKLPRRFVRIDTLPRNPAGKVQKNELRRAAAQAG